MKLSLYPLAILLFFISSCNHENFKWDSTVKFTEPQPKDGEALKEFPKYLQGTYTDSTPKYTIIINDKFIESSLDMRYRTIIDSFKGRCIIKDDSLIIKDSTLNNKGKLRGLKIERKGDSIMFGDIIKYPVYTLSDSVVLKKYKGYYILNKRNKKTGWSVNTLSILNGVLTLNNIKDSTALANLNEIIENKNDTLPANFNATLGKKFKIIKADSIANDMKYYRIKK